MVVGNQDVNAFFLRDHSRLLPIVSGFQAVAVGCLILPLTI
jgi:hypothetical protein